ncbi:MAG: antibiotic biosynthesis monooxygenase [Terrimicrobiaceae bacterium]|nr:antibiotic biosynthesis monooxygenase [Terrimicrobiaceae bacterium]
MEAFDAAGVTGIVWRRVAHGKEAQAEAVMREIMQLARQAEGFLGSEIFPPIPGVQDGYVVLYRFGRGIHLRAWLASSRRQELLQQIAGLLREPAVEFFFTHGRQQAGTASSVFAYRIRPDKEAAFQEWRRRILEEVRTWKGFLGTESFDTLDGSRPEFIVVVRFDDRANLDAWLKSKVRRAFMTEVRKYVDHVALRRIGSGFEGWFDTSEHTAPPARWRQALVILSALFPVIMVMRHLLSQIFVMLPLPVAFLILLALDMALLTYAVMPRYSRWMHFWLRPRERFNWRGELAGWAVIVGTIGVTLLAFLSMS